MNHKSLITKILVMGFLCSCASALKVENEEQLQENKEFDKAVKIEVVEQPPAEVPAPAPVSPEKKSVKIQATGKIKKHEPKIEDGEGFNGRRPIIDPFRAGEKVILDVSYLKMSAGTLELRVDPFVQVNGKTSYQFVGEIKTNRFFESMYTVHDKAVVLMDYEQLIPRVYTLHVKETGQAKEARSFFDFQKMQANYWEKKVTEKSGLEEKKQQWKILPFSQNVLSAIFYMRVFKWDIGKEYSFRVADDEQNLIFKGKALKRETLTTDIGEVKTILIQPQVILRGVLKPTGDIFMWLSDDEKKQVLRMEMRLSFGTLVFDVSERTP